MLRQSTAAALQMSAPAPSKELERQQAGGFCAVPFSPTFSPSPPRNLATASFISPCHLHTSPPHPPPAKELRKRHCLLAALLSSAALWLSSEYHRSTLKPAAQLEAECHLHKRAPVDISFTISPRTQTRPFQ
ncbi:uncharacterized protein LOC101682339 isoform X6 [Mustela putorius furo]|uniref:Uncharacterized protein LOC101682339 isoform X6 n=1 Tax=Mustela putorius furo TaxID=9669 RepID=A0A8U0NPF9_MUSPF|nr:uncharacterized protein LOC101682339 isoform X6 [Mustela putorius furo]